ncbi:RNA-binding protein [Methanolobus halotolerans]|uniref:RNA-binding protein n=1 Tax=Methanolobus halotolerans TaxID=2052935 RepID=A0A4E0Q0Q7_9EURY|nr:RNA-binding protein [Methanolobus halotolerans]TGC10552.1 RNA-binding protein [Methanolobus halotolerans]
MKVKSRVQIRKSDKIKLLKELSSTFGDVVDTFADRKFETATADEVPIVIIEGDVLLFKIGDTYFPTVKGVLQLGLRKNIVVVDAGAVRFVVNGADVMCPGIVSADDDIETGDPVIIVEETHSKPLAIGTAMIPGARMQASSGKAIKSVHYVGDKLWNLDI